MKQSTLMKGTFILTIAGLLTRALGFFYKIFLSNTLGAEKLGVYQLVFPIYSLMFTLYAGGIQTAISKLVAEDKRNGKKILCLGFLCSFSIAVACSFFLFFFHDFIAIQFIHEEACANSLKVLAFVFPFCSLTSCINGYYYGLKQAAVPATSQLFEQIFRIVSVYFIALLLGKGNLSVTCELAVLGIVIGEIASSLYNLISLFVLRKSIQKQSLTYHTFKGNTTTRKKSKVIFQSLLFLSFPLTVNHFLISILHSIEAILIPNMLQRYGLTNENALSIYGILTGMSMALIMFPSTITNSLSVLLLPSVSEAKAQKDETYISHTTSLSIKYSLFIGIFSTGIFLLFGDALGQLLFNNQTAGSFLTILSWLCPFIYLTTTLGSVLNGLGKTHTTFINSTVGLGLRIFFLLFFIPLHGIQGYLISLLVSQLAITFLDYWAIKKYVSFAFRPIQWLVLPIITISVLGFFLSKYYTFLVQVTTLPPLLLLGIIGILLLFLYLFVLYQLRVFSAKDLHN